MEITLTEVTYTPQSGLLKPLEFVRGMVRDLVACRELAWRLFIRDLSARYRQSFLGYIWAFIPPIMSTIPFLFLRSQGLLTTNETSIPYPAYVMIGMLLWQAFVDALQCPLKAVIAAKPMLSKIHFPPEAILIAGLGEVLFSFMIRLALLLGVFLWYGLTVPWTVLLLPLVVAALIMLGLMIGVLVTPIGVLYSDVAQALTIITSFWLFVTPVAFPVKDTGFASFLIKWNPVSPLIIAGRDWLTVGSTSHLSEFVFVSLASMIMLFFGWVSYRVALPHLIARIGN